MRKLTLLAISLLCITTSACSRSPAAPPVHGTLEVSVSWNGQGLPETERARPWGLARDCCRLVHRAVPAKALLRALLSAQLPSPDLGACAPAQRAVFMTVFMALH